MNRVWAFLLGFLANLASCADRHLQLSIDPVPVARLDEVRHAAMIGENQFLLVTGEPDSWQPRTLVRVDADGSEHPLVLPTRDTVCLGEALIARGPRWRYSRCSGNGVQFVSSEAAASFVPASELAREWLPFDDDEPGGVLLSVKQDERTVIARTVTPSGIEETLGTFDRGSTVWGAARGQALRLGADRIAVITIETDSNDPVHSSIVLRVMQNGDIATSRVAFHERSWASVAAAAGPSGQLAIVAAPFDESGVVAVMVDPAQPNRVITRHLVRTPAAGLRLIASGDRFIAGWIGSKDGAIRIAEFDDRVALPAITVAKSGAAISLGHVMDGITVFWTDGSKVMLRKVPEPPTGALIASDLLQALFDWARTRR